MRFTLDPRLEQESIYVETLSLCQVRLRDDRRFPWLLLIPETPLATELYELSSSEQALLIHEIALCSQLLRQIFPVHKINVGTLGNIVPQLHIHVIGRTELDACWPHPVWGHGEREPYTESQHNTIKTAFLTQLQARVSGL